MTEEQEAKERELFTRTSEYADVSTLNEICWWTWLARAEIAAETEAENVRLREALEMCRELAKEGMHHSSMLASYPPTCEVAWKIKNKVDAALAPKGATE